MQQEEYAANGPKEDKVKVMPADTLNFKTSLVLFSSLLSFPNLPRTHSTH